MCDLKRILFAIQEFLLRQSARADVPNNRRYLPFRFASHLVTAVMFIVDEHHRKGQKQQYRTAQDDSKIQGGTYQIICIPALKVAVKILRSASQIPDTHSGRHPVSADFSKTLHLNPAGEGSQGIGQKVHGKGEERYSGENCRLNQNRTLPPM